MNTFRPSASHRAAGLSLVEMLLALAITAVLLTATMVAVDVSFRAYAAAAESASAQTVTRMVSHRVLTLIRTSEAHGPLLQADVNDWEDAPEYDYGFGDPSRQVTSPWLALHTPAGEFLRLVYREGEFQGKTHTLWLERPDEPDFDPQPLLRGVAYCQFHLRWRPDRDGFPVLERATMDLRVEPAEDNTLAIEQGAGQQIRMTASTMPRRLD